MGLAFAKYSQSSHSHLRWCTSYISCGMSVVPIFEMALLMPTNGIDAANRSE